MVRTTNTRDALEYVLAETILDLTRDSKITWSSADSELGYKYYKAIGVATAGNALAYVELNLYPSETLGATIVILDTMHRESKKEVCRIRGYAAEYVYKSLKGLVFQSEPDNYFEKLKNGIKFLSDL